MILKMCIESLKNSGWDDTIHTIAAGIPLNKYIENISLNYYEATRLIMCLGIQLASLHSINKSICFLSFENIIRINQDWFLIQTMPTPVSIIDDQTIIIEEPILNNKNILHLSFEI